METRLLHLVDVAETHFPPRHIKPELFVGTHEWQLGKAVGLSQFGVNQLTLEPGAISALRHWHEGEDEFVYVLSGILTVIDDNGEHELRAGAFAGFPAGHPTLIIWPIGRQGRRPSSPWELERPELRWSTIPMTTLARRPSFATPGADGLRPAINDRSRS